MPALKLWGPGWLEAKPGPIILFSFFSIILILASLIYPVPVHASTWTCTSTLVEVYPDGSVAVNETLSVPEAPVNVSVRLLGAPLYILAVDSGGAPLPLTYNATQAVITVYSTGQVSLHYYTINPTSKLGETWSLSFESSCPTTILLPENSIPVSVEPAPTPVIVGNRTGLAFPGGVTITLNYYLIPAQLLQGTEAPTTAAPPAAPPSAGGTSKYLYISIIVIILFGIALYAALSKRGRGGSLSEEVAATLRGGGLDERDKKIIEALKRKPMSAPELIQETNIPKTPLYRRLNKLVEDGVIEFYEEGGVRIYRLKESREGEAGATKR